MNTSFQQMAMWCLIVAVVALAAMPAVAAEIVLKSLAIPQGTVVRLGEVAEIKAADSREIQRLAALQLMPAPTPGKMRFLRLREVQDLLAANGEDMNELHFRGASEVEIGQPAPPMSRFRAAWAGQPIPDPARVERHAMPAESKIDASDVSEIHEQIEGLFVDYLTRASGRNANWRVTFDLRSTDLNSLAGAKSELKCMGGNTPWTGRQKLVVTYTTAEGMARLPVFVEVAGMQPVVVAIQPIERGKVVTAADVEVQNSEDVPVATKKRTPFDSIEPIVGMEAARTIQAGDMVMSDDVRPQLLVKRGDEIAVYARGGGIQVRTLARARQDGARGQLITVESIDSKEPFDAVIVGPREAVVFSGGATPSDDKVAERPFRKLRQQ